MHPLMQKDDLMTPENIWIHLRFAPVRLLGAFVATGGSAVFGSIDVDDDDDTDIRMSVSVPTAISNLSNSSKVCSCLSCWMGVVVVSLTGTAAAPEQQIRHTVNITIE